MLQFGQRIDLIEIPMHTPDCRNPQVIYLVRPEVGLYRDNFAIILIPGQNHSLKQIMKLIEYDRVKNSERIVNETIERGRLERIISYSFLS